MQYVVILAAELNLMVAAGLIVDGFLRKRAYSEVGAPLQRLVVLICAGFTAIGVASLDINGGNRILSVGWRIGLQASIRVLMELGLFEVGDTYTHALRSHLPEAGRDRLPETTRVLTRGLLAAIFSGTVASWEVLGVPDRQRQGCLLSKANTVRNLGTASIDLSFFVYTFAYALYAKKSVSDRLRAQPNSKTLAGDKMAVEILTTHILALCGAMGLVFSFALLAAFRNAGAGRYLCEQPACTRRAYPSRLLWALWYHAGVWVAVFALVPNRLASRLGRAIVRCALGRGDEPRQRSANITDDEVALEQKAVTPSELVLTRNHTRHPNFAFGSVFVEEDTPLPDEPPAVEGLNLRHNCSLS